MSNTSFSVLSNCIAASAGTGKTYRLVSRYISLLCLGARPDSLVALTFTNKAAGEFRNRILEALAQGALFEPDPKQPREKQRNPLAVRVVETLFGVPADESGTAETVPLLAGADAGLLQRAEAAGCFPEDYAELKELLKHALDAPYFCTLLEQLIRQLPQLQLSTFDSFFQKLVSQHCMELGLGDVRPLMGEEEKRARKEALHTMIQLHDKDEELRRGFIEMCLSVTKGNPKGLEEKLAKYVDQYGVLTELYPDVSAWRKFEEFGLEDLTETPAMAADEWAILKEEYEAARTAVKADFKPNSHPDQATRGFLSKMEANNFGGMSRLNNYLDDAKSFSGEGHERLRALIRHIQELERNNLFRATELKTLGMYRLLRAYTESYRHSVQSTGRMTFSEMTKAAQGLFEMQATEEENCRYDHWMLDEFQDTNRAQWNALRGLLDDVVTENELIGDCELGGRKFRSSARSLFVVGDKKQGIYGFRGTDDSLFSMLHDPEAPAQQEGDEQYHDVLVPSSLSLSYRSAQSVMGKNGAVNDLFKKMKNEVEKQADGPKSDEESRAIASQESLLLSTFCHHNTTRSTQGHFRMEMLEKTADADTLREKVMPQAIVRILKKDLITEAENALRPELTVAVLVRTNDEAKAIVQYLHRELPHLPVQLVGDSEVAAASALGEVFFSLFLWLQHPSDPYRLGVLSLSPLAVLTQHEAGAEAAHAALLNALDERGYAAFLRERMIPLFPECAGARTFDEWVAAATEFDLAGGTLTEWIDFMKERSSQDAASSRAVQVMTMHKSKGLEFDAVIIPYIDDNAIDSTKNLDFFTTEDAVMVSPGGSGQREAFNAGPLPSLEKEWQFKQRSEAYNLMYVAITRAKYANYLLLRSVGKLTKPKQSTSTKKSTSTQKSKPYVEVTSNSAADVLARAVVGAGRHEEGSENFKLLTTPGVLYKKGTEKWYTEMLEDKAKKRASSQDSKTLVASALKTPTLRRRKVSPSKLEEEEAEQHTADDSQQEQTELKAADSHFATDFGTDVHACFEQIEWLEAGQSATFCTANEKAEKAVRAALTKPEIAAVFRRLSKRFYAYNEQDVDAIDNSDGQEVWVSGIIDRLVLEYDADDKKPVRAAIYDYKTNRIKDGNTLEQHDAELKKHYLPQMRSYCRLIVDMFHLPTNAVTATLIAVPSNAPEQAHLVPLQGEE